MARALIIILFFSQLLNMFKKEPNLKQGEALHNNYCISCHSSKDNNLFSKNWRTNKSLQELSETINNGISSTEMIGFKNRLTENEVFNLASYIIKKLNDSLDFESANNENRKEAYQTEKHLIRVEKIFDGKEFLESDIEVIWGISFLDSNNIIFSERKGSLFRYNLSSKELFQIVNVPEVYSHLQAGLLDVMVHPKYSSNNIIYPIVLQILLEVRSI